MPRAFDVLTDQVVESFDSERAVTLRLPDGNLLTADKCSLEFRLDADERSVEAILLTVTLDRSALVKAVRGGAVAMSPAELLKYEADVPITLLLTGADEVVELAGVLHKQDWPTELIAAHRTEDGFSTFFDLANYEHIDPRQPPLRG